MVFLQVSFPQELQQLRFVPFRAIRKNVVKLIYQVTGEPLQILLLDQSPGLVLARISVSATEGASKRSFFVPVLILVVPPDSCSLLGRMKLVVQDIYP